MFSAIILDYYYSAESVKNMPKPTPGQRQPQPSELETIRETLENNLHDCGKMYVIDERSNRPDHIKHYADEILGVLATHEQELIDRYDEIFRWLLGEEGDFPLCPSDKRYCWRNELRQKLSELRKGL